MSWDLYVVPPEHADDPGDWLESLEEEGGAADRDAAREHAQAILARRPELESFDSGDDGVVELSAPEDSGFPVQVFLDGRHAEIGVAYWDLAGREAELAELVVDVVSAVRERTGWVAFDPQEGRVVEPAELRALFAQGHGAGVEIVREITGEKPRKRFFGLF